MKRSTRLPVLLLALAMPLCLSSSQAGPRETGDLASAQEAGVCEPGSADLAAEARARLARLAAQEAAVQAAGEVIVLNGQGYNYGTDGAQDLEQIQEELQRQLQLAR